VNPAAPNTCSTCPSGSYCPGGDKLSGANPSTLGSVLSCGGGLVTRGAGMSAPIDCVAPGGFSMNGTNAAAPCLASTYAPPLNRLAKCLRCQSGLAEDPADALADSQRTNRRTVCSEFSRLPRPPVMCDDC
jgi:hypothetical protein